MLVNEPVQAADLAARLAHKVMRFTKTIAACAIAAAMQFADHSEVELERLQSERHLEQKRRQSVVNP